jgi:hypothetical protein
MSDRFTDRHLAPWASCCLSVALFVCLFVCLFVLGGAVALPPWLDAGASCGDRGQRYLCGMFTFYKGKS